jgi:hypothetical protein
MLQKSPKNRNEPIAAAGVPWQKGDENGQHDRDFEIRGLPMDHETIVRASFNRERRAPIEAALLLERKAYHRQLRFVFARFGGRAFLQAAG